MQNLFSLARRSLCLGLVVATSLVTTPTPAQVRIPQNALQDIGDLNEIIHRGETLERERRWNDALAHYENALRDYPGRRELRQRLTITRCHLEIARRYADRSFLASLDRLSQQQALDLYSEVLLKIETYHVDQPNWSHLVQQGMLHLEVATTEPAFVDRYPQPVATGMQRTFSGSLHQTVAPQRIKNRLEARDAAVRAAQVAAHYLHVPPQATIMEFTCGAAAALDPYSAYLSGDQLDEVFSQIEGNFVGLGIELKADNHALLIVSVIPGGPAEAAGVHADDRIVQVDGKPTADMSTDAAADMLKGAEFSVVEVIVESPDKTRRTLRIQRRRVDVASVLGIQILDKQHGVGYLKLSSFQKNTSRDVDAALWSLHRQGMRALIVDVRNNPGGLLNAAVEIADKFLDSGTIVSTRGRSIREDFDYKSHQVGTWRVPLIVLIDGDSASASEIFAGAIRDHHRGTVIGQKSYGKGSVQGIFPLTRFKAGIRLTTAKFFSPSGQPISHRGVTPDVVVHVTAKPNINKGGAIRLDQDPVLRAALDVASKSGRYQVRRTN